MRTHRAFQLVAAAVVTLASSRAQAEAPWSAAAHAGLVFPAGQRHGDVNSGGWVDLMHAVVPHWSMGAEAGCFKLPATTYGYPAVVGYTGPTGQSRGIWSASGAIRGRSAGPVRVHMLGTFGCYDLVTRTHFAQGDDQVEHVWSPGFSLGIGVSGSGLVRPGFQLRWHETLGPEDVNLDLVTFEAGLHFN